MRWCARDDEVDGLYLEHASRELDRVLDLLEDCVVGDWHAQRIEGPKAAARQIETENPDFLILGSDVIDPESGDPVAALERRISAIPVLLLATSTSRDLGAVALQIDAIGTCEPSSLTPTFLDDLVERELDRALVRNRNDRTARAVEFAQEGVIIADAQADDNPIVYCNRAFERLTGYDAETVLGRDCRFLQCDETSPETVDTIRDALRSDESVRVEIMNARRDGEPFWNELSITPVLGSDGRVHEYIGFQRDVTERVNLEQKLEKYQHAVETADELIVLKNLDGQITLANESAADALDCTRSEIVGRRPGEFVSEKTAEHFREHTRATLRSGGPVTRRRTMELPAGERTFEITRVPFDPTGEVRGTVTIARNLTERRDLQEKLKQRTLHDDVTGLPSRQLFEVRAEAMAEERLEAGGELTVAVADVDDFRAVNDQFGRERADELLEDIARRLKSSFEGDSVVARLGGDVFALLVPALDRSDKSENVAGVARQLDEAFDQPFECESTPVHLSLSIGIARSGPKSHHSESATGLVNRLVETAEREVQRAKSEPGHSWRLAAPTSEPDPDDRIERENRIRQGLDRDEFVPVFQPFYDLGDSALWGLEMLARWRRPDDGKSSPAVFIPIADRAGLLQRLTEQTLRRAGARFERLEMTGEWPNPVQLNINLSPSQIASRDLTDRLGRFVDQHIPDTVRVSLEITEGQLFEQRASIEALQDADFRIIVDDFGTGHSSLTRLTDLPLDELKLDMKFVHGAVDSEADRAILGTVAELGRQLGVPVVAEGVETRRQLELVRDSGCTAAQGYLLGRPGPLGDVPTTLRSLDDSSGMPAANT